MDLSEAQAQLASVNAAITLLIQGKLKKELVVGSGNFQRRYTFETGSLTLENLKAYRNELLQIINVLSPATLPTFRANAVIPNIITKREL